MASSRDLNHPEAPLQIVRDEGLGWRTMPGWRITLDDDLWFTTDADGWRRDDRHDGRPPLVVLGDSFTYAAGVADGAIYCDRIAATSATPPAYHLSRGGNSSAPDPLSLQ